MKIIPFALSYAIAWVSGGGLFQQPQVSSPPDIEVLSARWKMIVGNQAIVPASPLSATIQRSDKAYDPIPVQNPTPRNNRAVPASQWYAYSAVIVNGSQKKIKAFAWDYVFSDAVTHEELKRQSGFSVGLRPGQKKTTEFKIPSSPPTVVNANAAQNARSPFAERVVIQCILFADGTLWEQPEANHKNCEMLQRVTRNRAVVFSY